MQYREDKYGNKLSILGFGCMRFPTNSDESVNYEETEKLLNSFDKNNFIVKHNKNENIVVSTYQIS